MKEIRKKHSVYFDLVEAMGEKGCPICLLTQRASKQYLTAILNEGVNDPPLRSKLRNSLGFCNAHAWMLRDIGDSLATAILYKDFVDELASTMERGLEELEECPACVSAAEAEKDYLTVFCKHLHEEEFIGRYDSSWGLCYPHLSGALKMTKGKRGRAVILGREADKLGKLSHQLAEYIRKKDYRYAHESHGDERNSWVQAVEKVTGSRR